MLRARLRDRSEYRAGFSRRHPATATPRDHTAKTRAHGGCLPTRRRTALMLARRSTTTRPGLRRHPPLPGRSGRSPAANHPTTSARPTRPANPHGGDPAMSRTLTTCRRCHTPLSPVYPGQREHPLCSPAPKGWIPPDGEHHRRTLQLALAHAARGWHVLPLSPDSKRPLGNCPACRDYDNGKPPHRIEDCPCIPAGCLVPRRPRRYHRPRDDHQLVAEPTRCHPRHRHRPLAPVPDRHRQPQRPLPRRARHRAATRHRPDRREPARSPMARSERLP